MEVTSTPAEIIFLRALSLLKLYTGLRVSKIWAFDGTRKLVFFYKAEAIHRETPMYWCDPPGCGYAIAFYYPAKFQHKAATEGNMQRMK